MTRSFDHLVRAAAVAMACMLSSAVQAQSPGFPSKPIRLIVPQPPGGTADTVGRVLAEFMGQDLGEQIIVDNRPGASSSIGMEAAARSAPDGYTLIVASSTGLVVNPLMMQVRFDPLKDFEPVGLVSEGTVLMVANPEFPAKDLRDVVALARKRPDEIAYATWGLASPAAVCMQMIVAATGIRMNQVPYKGGSPLVADMVAGHIKVGFADSTSAFGPIQSGKLKALASCAGPSEVIPGVPSFKDQGIDYDFLWRTFLLAPAGTPQPVLERLNQAFRQALARPEAAARLKDAGTNPMPTQPPMVDLKPIIERDTILLKKILGETNAKATSQ
ncbi:MAG: tripartite tricarboxylate transporter substrate binding protein [Reyranella sp.]|jgi:tripartite-type tricarboxylate transporter receptor subunit TctC|uniref:Bug family tripartite tricarboxylate transporter substrate binding protein n=1 Tax=Reyranella sp. TaxID=1929291 RepID=UPI0025D881F5|nr:tripartite tricarboxylate transporter substrate binding protein [Reyranella sp.]MBR2813303.1 tripartite tricarboxylate transporter substrate binding protein [Reyranella sp.]